jgi:hypothetical protein
VTIAAKVPIRWPGLHPPAKSASNETRILLCVVSGDPVPATLACNLRLLGKYSSNSMSLAFDFVRVLPLPQTILYTFEE